MSFVYVLRNIIPLHCNNVANLTRIFCLWFFFWFQTCSTHLFGRICELFWWESRCFTRWSDLVCNGRCSFHCCDDLNFSSIYIIHEQNGLQCESWLQRIDLSKILTTIEIVHRRRSKWENHQFIVQRFGEIWTRIATCTWYVERTTRSDCIFLCYLQYNWNFGSCWYGLFGWFHSIKR